MKRHLTAAAIAAAVLFAFPSTDPGAHARPTLDDAADFKANPPSRHHELRCLTTAMYFEARGETRAGWRAVGRVILNRVASRYYPDTICAVVYQNAKRRNACQFSFACDGIPDTVREPEAWLKIAGEAENLVACIGDIDCETSEMANELWSATHYHADYVHPRWARKIQLVGQLGRHLFYYTPTM